MGLLEGKRVLLGVSGGIAAYKTPELVRRMQDAGADVQVMLTAGGARFVSPLSLEVVSTHKVHQDLWATETSADATLPSPIVHTDIGQGVDLIVLAPATANLIGRIAGGLADDLLTTSVMACRTPVLVCPAMNTDMLDNPLVQRNLALLDSFERYTLLQPGVGLLACGVTGAGRMPDPPDIIEAAAAVLTRKRLRGLKVTVSAGPTREAVDPVRYLSNNSTGTMGFALARAFGAAGADVTLIAGPVDKRTPVGVEQRVDVVTAADMRDAVFAAWARTDVLVMTAAVADFRPAAPADHKIKKGADTVALPLERTADILAATAGTAGREGKTVVGFAAESRDLEVYAAEKLERKNLDWIVANDISQVGTGFGVGDNAGILLGRGGVRVELPRTDKQTFAERIVEALIPALAAK